MSLDEALTITKTGERGAFGGEILTVNFGPHHPSTHGVLRLIVDLDGEQIKSVTPVIGYLHTGIEKQAEALRWQQVVVVTDRHITGVLKAPDAQGKRFISRRPPAR